MNIKLKKISFILLIVLSANANAFLPIYPAEILGRDLNTPHLGWVGHVGIATAPSLYEDAYQVLEVLNDNHPIQLNFISDFKSRTKYWGSRYGIADRGNGALRI